MSVNEQSAAITAADPDPDAPDKPLGPVNAAMIAGGLGCLFLGLFTILAEASKSAKETLTLMAPVGALSGKVIFAVVGWIVVWIILHFALRKSALAFRTAFMITLILIAFGLVGTFPLVFEAFG